MSRSVRFLPAAEHELVAAIEWYEGHDPGVALAFETAIDTTLEHVVAAPHGGTRWQRSESIRTWRVRRFPFLIVYRTAPELLVIAIAHTKRRPAYWARRTTRGA